MEHRVRRDAGSERGMTLHLEHPAPGVAAIGFGGSGRRLTYRADPERHRITIHDDFGRLQLAFGARGRGAGGLDTPLDLALVHPSFPGEHLPMGHPCAIWLAVADYGNRRIQVFELDGAPVGAIALTDHPALGAPCGLAWRDPYLEIAGADGARASILLAASMLHGSAPAGRAPRLPREWRPTSYRVN
jgi:hypothetical protein